MATRESVSGDASACLRWLHVNVVLSRGVPLSEEQLRQLSHAVGDDAVCLAVVVMLLRGGVTTFGVVSHGRHLPTRR
jgi:hypothetical protein